MVYTDLRTHLRLSLCKTFGVLCLFQPSGDFLYLYWQICNIFFHLRHVVTTEQFEVPTGKLKSKMLGQAKSSDYSNLTSENGLWIGN
jgi:hypothetical protein